MRKQSAISVSIGEVLALVLQYDIEPFETGERQGDGPDYGPGAPTISADGPFVQYQTRVTEEAICFNSQAFQSPEARRKR